MPIPTMAIACRPDHSSSGPAISSLLSNVINSIETHSEELTIPTHLGIGVRFPLNFTENNLPGIQVDSKCRIDLLSIELGSTGAAPINPTPAVHIDASIWEQDSEGNQCHLYGSFDTETRLRSIDMNLGWHSEDVEVNGSTQKQGVWDASITLNDASFNGHIDWPDISDENEFSSKIPGKLVIDGMNSAVGAMECLGSFLTDYAKRESEEMFESFLNGISSIGLASKLGYDSLDPSSIWDDIPWTFDQLAIQTFLSDPFAYLSNIIHDPLGDVDLYQSLPYSEISILESFSNLIPNASIMDDPLDLRHGSLMFEFPLPFFGSFIHVYLTPEGVIGINTDSIELGPFDLYTSMNLPLFFPEEWDTASSMSLTLQAAPHISGILNGCAMVFTRNSPWDVTLELPDSGVVPSFTNGFNLVQPPSRINLSNPADPDYLNFIDLLDYVPGIILDSTIGILIENLLSPRLEKSGTLGIILSELELVSWDSYGGLSANSIFPIIYDPIGHLISCFTTSQGLDISTIMNVSNALLDGINLDKQNFNQLGDLIEFEIEPISKIKVPVSVFEIIIMENPDSVGSLTIGIQPNSELSDSLSGYTIDISALLRVNVHLTPSSPYLSLDLDGSFMDLNLDVGSMISGISGPYPLDGMLSSLSNAQATIQLELLSGDLHLSVSVDFNPSDPLSLPSIINILPFIGGIDTFLLKLITTLTEDVLSDLVEYAINELRFVPLYTGKSVGEMLEEILVALDLWNTTPTSELNFSNFESLCNNPGVYLQSYIQPLVSKIITLVYGFLPDSDGGIIRVTNHSGWISIKIVHADLPTWITDHLSLDLGEKHTTNESGIWLCYSQTIAIGAENLPVSLEVGMYRGTSDVWKPSTLLKANVSSPLMSTPFTIQPALRFGYDGDDFELVISTGVDTGVSTDPASTGSESFWVKVLPRTGTWQRDVDWGMPDLSAMLLGAANIALNFAEDNDAVQDFLAAPIYDPSSSGDWKDILRNLTIVGDWLVHLGVCSFEDEESPVNGSYIVDRPVSAPTPPPSGFFIRPLSEIISEYTDPNGSPDPDPKYPFKRLLKGSMDMILSVLSTSTVPIVIYERIESDFDFSISLNVQDAGSNVTQFGVTFDFADQTIDIGNMGLKIFTRTDAEEEFYGEDWSKKSDGIYSPGITIQMLSYDSTPGTSLLSAFNPFFSVEIGHLGFQLAKKDLQPLLDGFMLLKTVTATISMDYTFPAPDPVANPKGTLEFGGRLDLDDFGISLGGDGSEDGGNTLASGVLDGGEGNDSVRPMFDLAIWCYDGDVDIKIRGGLEYWFPVNKQFGPIKIAQIGVKYESVDSDGDENRLSILVDGEAEIAGFLAQVDDLSVSIPILEIFKFDKWKYDMAGCAISYSGPAFSLAGALRKTLVTPAGGGDEYIEYQGLVSISTKTMSINAIGAFGRVPVDGSDDSYVTCFVIAAIDTPIGGPPMFFVTGLLGGVGLNRELVTPDVTMVTSSPFMLAMDSSALAANPMGALESIRTHLPAERGSFWFAVGVKFTTFQVIESKAVLYIKISDDDFALGLIGLSAMSLPTPELNIGYIELAFAASYDSGTNIFRAEAQLTDASYLFSKSCRLTGGFALVNWFNRGDFLLSIGGYHPKFKVPSHYPIVPRLGFNWKPMSKIVIKGEAYFTVCSSAVMLGGGFEASYKSGCLSASFRAGVDVLIVFDPFFYSFRVYIGVSVRLKTWLGTLKAGLGADLEIEGPKMRGKARIEVVFIEFTVKFGSQTSGSAQPISGKEFMNKHILQRPADEFNASFKDIFEEQFSLIQPTNGLIRSSTKSEIDEDESLNGPFNLETEFEFAISHLFPSELHSAFLGSKDSGDEISNNWRNEISVPLDQQDTLDIAPCHVDADTNGAPFVIEIFKKGSISPFEDTEYCSDKFGNPIGLSYVSSLGHFAATLWSCEMDTNNSPKAKTSAPENQPTFLNGGSLLGRSTQKPISHIEVVNLDQTEPSIFVHNLPLRSYVDTGNLGHLADYLSKVVGATKDLTIKQVIRESKPSVKKASGIDSFSMDMLSNVLEAGNSKHVNNRHALDAHSRITARRNVNLSGRKNLGVRAVRP